MSTKIACRQPPKLILGTNEFGSVIDLNTTKRIVKRFIQDHNDNDTIYIDTALIYANGKSEKSLSLYSNDSNISISTKVTPTMFDGLTKKSIKKQCNMSLKKLNKKCVDILYIHNPSTKTHVLEALYAINELYKEGKMKRFGICGYSSWQVTEIVYLCEKYNLIKPSVYQGRYNVFRREIESELIPCLRYFNISFNAYSPTARGLMAGNHKFKDKQNSDIKPGKFTQQWSAIYFNNYWYKSFFDARDRIQIVANKNNISLLQGNFSWLLYHSILDGSKGDRIIIGGSQYEHYNSNFNAIKNATPLNNEMVNVFQDAWRITRQENLTYHESIEDVMKLFAQKSKL
eukprot:157425_1